MVEFFSWLPQDELMIEELAVADYSDKLFPQEKQSVDGAVVSRLQEFSTGRECARRALASLGIAAVPIMANRDRSPNWPEGVIGSITHTNSHCAVAVAPSGEPYDAIGLDLENIENFSIELIDTICLEEERRWLETQPIDLRPELACTIFSAKECAYKAQYPASKVFLEFSEMLVRLDIENGRFFARLLRDCDPYGVGTVLPGHFKISDGHVASAVLVARDW